MSVTVAQSAVWSAPSNASPVFNSTNGWVTPAAGSILLVIINWVSGTPTTPTGWNVGNNTQTPTRSQLVYWMVAAGTESTVTISGSFGAATLIELAGADTTAPIHKIAVAFNAAANPQVTPVVTPTIPNTLAVASLWSTTSTNGNASSGAPWTDLPPNTGRGNYYQSVAYSLQDSSLAAVSDTFTLVSVTATAGVMTLLVTPASAPSGTTGSGSATVGAANASGAASSSALAQGAATAGQASASALASVTSTSAGAATASPATAQGVAGLSPSAAAGNAVAGQSTAAGAASQTSGAVVAATVASASASGTAAGTAGNATATGAATANAASAAASASVTSTSAGSAIASPATAQGFAGLAPSMASGHAVAGAVSAQASANVTAIGAGHATAAPATAVGVASVTTSATAVGSATASPANASASATNSTMGVVLAFVRPATAHGSGGLPQNVEPNRTGVLPGDIRAAQLALEQRTARLTA